MPIASKVALSPGPIPSTALPPENLIYRANTLCCDRDIPCIRICYTCSEFYPVGVHCQYCKCGINIPIIIVVCNPYIIKNHFLLRALYSVLIFRTGSAGYKFNTKHISSYVFRSFVFLYLKAYWFCSALYSLNILTRPYLLGPGENYNIKDIII